MSEMPEDLLDMADDYLSGVMDEGGLSKLEARLRADPEARWHFVRYCRLDTDLHLEGRARKAGLRAMKAIDQLQQPPAPAIQKRHKRRGWIWGIAAAAVILLAIGVYLWSLGGGRSPLEPHDRIAWLVNAQDCQWADHQAPSGDMRAGKMLRLRQGLAEIRFGSDASILLEGPANLELLTNNSARLLDGKLTAKVPASAKGFQITSPHGKVVDLGTEFAISVGPDGNADVYVFAGKVEAYSSLRENSKAPPVSVGAKQAARIEAGQVTLIPAKPGVDVKQFIREIVPSPKIVPRVFTLDFRQPISDTLLDSTGLGIGLTHRLPGTGKKLKTQDDNLRLETADGRLAITTTDSDLNTSKLLDWGEYLGIRLADLGFTGKEDFAITVVLHNIPELPKVGQFGLYAGPHSKENIRGGLLSMGIRGQYKQFLVQNHKGKDIGPHRGDLVLAGEDLRLTLRRDGSDYLLTVENITTGMMTTISLRQPEFLEGENDFYVGFFGANTQSKERRTLLLKEFKVTVWTVAQ